MQTLRITIGLSMAVFLGGCNIFSNGPTEVDINRPMALNPENDIFSTGDTRVFSVSEGIIRTGSKDTTFAVRSLAIVHAGDTVIGGAARKRVVLGATPSPASILALLGLNPNRLFFDTLAIPDPGYALRFPDTPYVGWKLDTLVGQLRYVRRTTKVEIVGAAGLNQECWVFADSTYWGKASVSTGTYWMGAKGLVLHRQEWKGYASPSITGGTFWREIRAAN